MAKTTKAQARDAYDTFHNTLRHLNGGTTEENERSAPACYASLAAQMVHINTLIANPGKRLLDDDFLWPVLQKLPTRAEAFRVRYGLEIH